jgi:hypothetical protein
LRSTYARYSSSDGVEHRTAKHRAQKGRSDVLQVGLVLGVLLKAGRALKDGQHLLLRVKNSKIVERGDLVNFPDELVHLAVQHRELKDVDAWTYKVAALEVLEEEKVELGFEVCANGYKVTARTWHVAHCWKCRL